VTLVDHSRADADMPAAPATGDPTIYVCVTCRPPGEPDNPFRPGALLAQSAAQAAEGAGVKVVRVKCLAVCTRGPTAALRAEGAWTYVFSGLALDAGAVLVEGARLLAQAADGVLPWRGRPEPLKRGLVARVPPLGFEEERE
jgi:predicted metal-binding protein